MEAPAPPLLRERFTHAVAEQLSSGKSISLISPHGQGRRRTLHDLHAVLAQQLHIYQMNIRSYPADYKGFLKHLYSQINHPSTAEPELEPLLSSLAKPEQQTLLILHNFDELITESEQREGYPNHLFDQLNRIEQYGSVALLTISEVEQPADRLHAEQVTLPPLNRNQLIRELERRALIADKRERKELAEWLLRQSAPYSILDDLSADWFRQKRWRSETEA